LGPTNLLTSALLAVSLKLISEAFPASKPSGGNHHFADCTHKFRIALKSFEAFDIRFSTERADARVRSANHIKGVKCYSAFPPPFLGKSMTMVFTAAAKLSISFQS